MARRIVNRRPLQKVAVGDMREYISIQTRAITPPVFGSDSVIESYSELAAVWAQVETAQYQGSGQVIFDGVDTGEQVTHKFTIRYFDGVTTENRILWNGDYYKILKVVDPEGRKEYQVIYAKLLGDKDLEANK